MSPYGARVFVAGAVLLLTAFSAWGAGWRPDLGQPLYAKIGDSGDSPEEFNWNVVWDADGIAYLGRDRLWRWDGTALLAIGPDIFRQLRALAFDESGRLWLGGVNQFGWYDPESDTYHCWLDRLPAEMRNFGAAWKVHCEGDRVWLATANRLFQFADGTFSFWEFPSQHRVIFHFLNSGIYAHETDVGLWKVNKDGPTLINDSHALSAESVLLLAPIKDSHVLAISSKGLFFLSSDLSNIHRLIPVDFGDEIISCAIVIDDNQIAVGTLGGGVFILSMDGDVKSRLMNSESEHDFYNLFLSQDSSKRLWDIQDQGSFVSLIDVPAGIIEINNRINSSIISAVKEIGETLFVSSERGLFSKNFRSDHLSYMNRVIDGEIRNTASFRDRVLFDRYNALYAVEDGEALRLHAFEGEIQGFAVTEAGLLGVLFTDRVWIYRMGADEALQRLGEVATGGGVLRLEADGAGRIWGWGALGPLLEIGEDGDGGYRQEWHEVVAGVELRGREHAFGMTAAGPVLLFDDRVLAYNGGSGEWRAGAGRGSGGRVDALAFRREAEGIRGWVVAWDAQARQYQLEEMEWPRGGAPAWRVLPWVDMGRLGKVHTMTVTDDPERFFLIGGMRGVMLAGRALPDAIPPPEKPVIFDSGGLLRARGELEAQYGAGPLRFHFSTPGGNVYYPIRYKTRLRGAEPGWSAASELGLRELGRIPEGRYAFEVKAVDPFGRESAVASVGLRIHPPWFRTAQAYLSYLLVLAGLAYAVIRLRERRLRLREAELVELVSTRTRELERANEFKDDFIANLSHEIRNPLNGVIGFIRQLRPDVPPPAGNLKALRGAAHYLQTTVEEVLDFSKLESGRIEPENDLFDLRELASGVAEIYRGQAASKGIVLDYRLDIPDRVGPVADARKVQQILGNLAGNAVKFTEQGRVDVAVELKADGGRRGTVRIRVEDTGPGIPEEAQRHIFEKFYQVKSGGMKPSGTGLGLALIKCYVDCMGGRIELESAPGCGTRFVVELPVETGELGEAATVEAACEPVCAGLPVLVVEDVDYNRMLLCQFLERLGCQVDQAADGLTGLQMARSGRYRAVFLDWLLPGMNGPEIARALSEEVGGAVQTRIFGVTAGATAEIRRQCLDAGMEAFLTKPIRIEQIRELILSCLPAGRFIRGRGLLAEMAGSGDWAATLKRWREFLADYVGELAAAVEEADPEGVRKAAHRLLGHLRMLELDDLPDAVKDLMTAAASGDHTGIRAEWKRLEELLERFNGELDAQRGVS
jgi:signal transduction histidine kinase/CheY-like chemotaxis protein